MTSLTATHSAADCAAGPGFVTRPRGLFGGEEAERREIMSIARPSESSPTNADDRLPRAPLGRVEGGDSLVEGRDVADVRPQSSVPHPLDDLTQLGTIG